MTFLSMCWSTEHLNKSYKWLFSCILSFLYLCSGDKSSSSSSVVRQARMERRDSPWGRWTPCHVELTPCELRLYILDSSANRQLFTAYSLSHCQSVVSPAPSSQHGQIPQPPDQRTLQALFFDNMCIQLRAFNKWEAIEWRQLILAKVQAARPVRPENSQWKSGVENQQVTRFPIPMSPSPSPSPSGLDGESDISTSVQSPLQEKSHNICRPTTLPLLTQHYHDILKAGVLHLLMDQNNWLTFTFVLTTSTLQAFPAEGCGTVFQPVLQYSLAVCTAVQHDRDLENKGLWTERGFCIQMVFPKEVLRLCANDQLEAREWVEALRKAVGAHRPPQKEVEDLGKSAPALEGVLLRSAPSREGREREAQRTKRNSVTTSFLSILTCLAAEKGLTAQGFRCAGKFNTQIWVKHTIL